MERQEYEQMVNEMREKCIVAYTHVKDLYDITPSSIVPHLWGYVDTLKWEFKVSDDEKSRPYLAWSLGPDLSQKSSNWFDYLVTACYERGEFSFYPYHLNPMRIYRRTPMGWRMQEESLVDEVLSIAKYAPRCDISALLRHITDTFLKVPNGLRTLIREKVDSSLEKDARMLFSKALHSRDRARAGDRDKKVREELMRMFLAEVRGIERDLEATKSFAKSKVLRAIRERCKRLGHNVEGMLPEYTIPYDD